MQRFLMIFSLMVLLSGCSTFFPTPEQQASQLKAEQDATNPLHQFNAPYDQVFRSAVRSLADLGFVIHNSEMASGLISASLEKDALLSNPSWVELWDISPYDPSIKELRAMSKQEVSILVDKIDDQHTQVRITPSKWDYVEKLNGQSRSRPLTWDQGVSCKKIFDALEIELDQRPGA